jgi:hypothetical protein
MLLRALHVGVLDAQEHPPAVAARVQEVEDCGSSPSDVQESGGGGGEAEFHGA